MNQAHLQHLRVRVLLYATGVIWNGLGCNVLCVVGGGSEGMTCWAMNSNK